MRAAAVRLMNISVDDDGCESDEEGAAPQGGGPEYPMTLLLHFAGRCWDCGSPRRATDDPTLGRLAQCGGCRVAVYCSTACYEASWRRGHRRVCRGWAAAGARAANVFAPALATSRARRTALIYDNVKESSERQVLLMPISVPLGGDWKTEWGYLRTVAADIEAAGLLLAEVVCVADVARGMIPRLPAEEYRHLPWAISEEHLARPLAKHGGRVLRVILCAHPPVMRVFGPRSLGLA